MSNLTPRQRQIYDYARACITRRGYGPTVKEIARHFQLRSTTAVRRHLRQLENQGLIQRVYFTARAIQLLPEEGADETAVAIVPRGPSVRAVDRQVEVDFRTKRVVLGHVEALRLAGQLVMHARVAGESARRPSEA
jgi:repressor LexA